MMKLGFEGSVGYQGTCRPTGYDTNYRPSHPPVLVGGALDLSVGHR